MNEKLIYYENLVRHNYLKLFTLFPKNFEDEVLLNLAIACGSVVISKATPPKVNNKILKAHSFIYRHLSKDPRVFNPIFKYPYNYTSLHLVFRHNVLYYLASNKKRTLPKEYMFKVFNSKLEVLMAYEYYMINDTLNLARDKKYNPKIQDVLNIIVNKIFPMFNINVSPNVIYDRLCAIYKPEYKNLKILKSLFKKYSYFYGYLYSYHLLGYIVHKNLITYPKVFEPTKEIMPLLKSVHLMGAIYILSSMFNLPIDKIPTIKSKINYEQYYYIK